MCENYPPVGHSRDAETQFDTFYACSTTLGGKSKASEKANKWKVIIHNRPEELKTGEMTFGCEILWATERDTRKFSIAWLPWSVLSGKWEWTDSLLRERLRRNLWRNFGRAGGEKKVFPAFSEDKLLKILLQFSKWVAKLELQGNLKRFFFLHPLNLQTH